MTNREHESEIALTLARRTYIYNLMHVVFGSEPTGQTVEMMFSEDAFEAFAVVSGCFSQKGCSDGATARLGKDDAAIARRVETAVALLEKARAASLDSAFADDLSSDYVKLFLLPGPAYVYPWESPYVGKEKLLFQESTLDVRSYYYDAGFKLQAERRSPDDHIAAMMDYLGRMSGRAFEAYADGNDEQALRVLKTQRAFLSNHVLNWIGDLAVQIAEKDERAYYAAFAVTMDAFVRFDDRFIEELVRELEGCAK